RTSPRSMWWRNSSRTPNTSTKSRANWRSRARTGSTKRRASVEWAETCRNERPRTRAVDARAHRDRDHDGLSDGLHADGPRHVLRLHRVLRPDPPVRREQGVRADGPAHLRRADHRRADLDHDIRTDGLRV